MNAIQGIHEHLEEIKASAAEIVEIVEQLLMMLFFSQILAK